jgi:L-lactate dehydrogenase complex protein LldG
VDKKIEKFIKMSETVGNEHLIMNKKEFTEYLKENDFDYSFLPSYKIKKDCEITKDGIGSAIVEADLAIIETGSVVVDSKEEKIRLATCLAEDLIVVLKEENIVNRLENTSKYMQEKMSDDASYIAFITGASRTADIERVLTIGVHGPVAMKIIVITSK